MPIGLSSLTTSPVSVTQLVIVTPASRPRTRNAGTGRPAACTTSRACTSMLIGELRSVAGSKTETTSFWPGSRPRAASVRGRFSDSAGGSARSRLSRRSPAELRIVRSRRLPSRAPSIVVGPVPGSSENEKRRSAKLRSTKARLVMRTAAVAPTSVIVSRASSRIS